MVTSFFLRSYRIEGSAMNPLLRSNSRILVSPLAYGPRIGFSDVTLPGIGNPNRGDIVLIRSPNSENPGFLGQGITGIIGFFTFQNLKIETSADGLAPHHQVKRIIGLPGDTIKMEDGVVFIRPKGESSFYTEFELIKRPYDLIYDPLPEGWKENFPFAYSFPPITLSDDQYYVLGDNRGNSLDSRFWGPIQSNDLLGRVILQYAPLNTIKPL